MTELKDIIAKSPTQEIDALQIMVDSEWKRKSHRFCLLLLISCFIFFTISYVFQTKKDLSLFIITMISLAILFLFTLFLSYRQIKSQNFYILIEKNGTLLINCARWSKCLSHEEHGKIQIEKSLNGKRWLFRKSGHPKPIYRLLVKAYPDLKHQYEEFLNRFYDTDYVGRNSISEEKPSMEQKILRIST